MGVLAPLLVTEIAKPHKDAETEVVRSADLIEYTAHSGRLTVIAHVILESSQVRTCSLLCVLFDSSRFWLKENEF